MAVSTNWLGEVIKRHRERAGITQAELAQRLGLHKQTIVKYEAGTISPPADRVGAIAAALGVSLPRFLDLEGDLQAAGVPIDDEGFLLDDDGHRIDETLIEPPPALQPRLSRNLPLAVREYLAEFRLRLTKADVPEAEIEEALDLMRSPELFTFYKGGVLSEYNEEEVLRGMKAIGEGVVIPELRERGRKIP